MKLIDDLRNLDRRNVGGWPRSVKIFFIVLLLAIVILVGWYFKVRHQQETLEQARKDEVSLKKEYTEKHSKAVNLEPLKEQLADMKDMLHQLLRQLPGKTDMPELLVDISQTALSAGIDIEEFKPEGEIPKDFYAEQPIRLKMIGTYHQFGTFISDVASLPRVVILTMHDVSLKPVSDKGGDELVLQGTVKTYRYLDDDENTGNDEGDGE